MKIRQGFVSNSSSSSFICDITGTVEETYEGLLSDVEMVRCENEHVFLYDYFKEVVAWVQSDENTSFNDGLPAALCPVCNGKAKGAIVDRLKKELARLNITVKDLQ